MNINLYTNKRIPYVYVPMQIHPEAELKTQSICKSWIISTHDTILLVHRDCVNSFLEEGFIRCDSLINYDKDTF